MKKVQEYLLYFMIYSVLGWCYEVFLEVVIYRWGFSDRGVLVGPYCIVYGFGALILLVSLSWLKEKKIFIINRNIAPALVFIGIVIVTTVIELAASYIMEFIRGDWMWDYTRFSFNFQGRVALNPSIRFGIGGMIILYLLHPLFSRAVKAMSDNVRAAAAGILAVILAADILFLIVRSF